MPFFTTGRNSRPVALHVVALLSSNMCACGLGKLVEYSLEITDVEFATLYNERADCRRMATTVIRNGELSLSLFA